MPTASGVLTAPRVPTVPGALSSAFGAHVTMPIPLAIDSRLRKSRARPIPLASLRRERAMWETTLFVILADNGGPICTLTALLTFSVPLKAIISTVKGDYQYR